jgi:hypothetical protein
MLLIYEWVYHPPESWSASTLLAWVSGPARTSLIAAVLDLEDIYGKVAGPKAMITAESYRPVFTLTRLRDFQSLAMRDLFFSWSWTPGWPAILALWAALFLFAYLKRDRPILRFLFWFLVVAPIPLEFLLGKGQACLALLIVAGAIFVAVVLVDIANSAADLFVHVLRTPPAIRRLAAGAMLVFALIMWVRAQWRLRELVGQTPMTSLGFETWDLIEQLRASNYRPRPATLVVFTEDPFPNTVDMYSLVRLWINDRSVVVHVTCQGPLPEETLAKAYSIFAIRNRKLVTLR